MKTLDSYSMMIVSKYFLRITDFVRVECVCKKFKDNMAKFHYNPIPLTNDTVKLFPHLETQHFYSENDLSFNSIIKKVYWHSVIYSEHFSDSNAIYKRVYLTSSTPLKNLVIPHSVYDIKELNFLNNELITSIIIPPTVYRIGSNTFAKLSYLQQVVLPLTITSIPFLCFEGCTCLSNIEIPMSVHEIGYNCFCGCSSLKNITVKASNNNIYYFKEKMLYESGCYLVSFNLPTPSTRVNTKRSSHYFIENFSIPTSVVSIGKSCFCCCKQLKEMVIPDSVITIGANCFDGCTSLSKIELSRRISEIKQFCFANCKSLLVMTIPSSVTRFEEHSFCNCFQLFGRYGIPNCAFYDIYST
ncbi:hypothetical protein EIN_485570 [Entamoeba invadens IP1]|uniref:Leucine rich repeat containing protein BspA family protein n=1 Tax=Entamoeba invadens IP1 TaxID=370355 RepID=A0A0A1U7W3_ENTIV|nr:hypothetical protein EIN_485570 [Entamoeba invadens IP1]ELP89165.1 hypothetical protein EIN_485570 [Entamoeba invadens IP1]|eukprot:XP_004255936.1 hypothetical protein EIN_485570 [Entamoeba invadens IP1]